jgi:hypothetical protein
LSREQIAALAARVNLIGKIKELVPLVEPSHLDGFQNLFIRTFGVIIEPWQFTDPFVQVGEAQIDGVHVGVGFFQDNGDVENIGPLHWRPPLLIML